MITEVRMILTRRCNLSCPYCHAEGYYREDISQELSAEQWIKGLDKFKDLKNLFITGGEPLHPTIINKTIAIARYAIQRGIKVRINTNGTYMHEFKEDDLKPLGFQVSIDGLPETHDKNRGRGNYAKSIAFIKKQHEAGHEIKIKHVIMNNSINDVKHVIQLGQELGVGFTQFQLIVPAGRGVGYKAIEDKNIIKLIQQNGADYRGIALSCKRHIGVGGQTASVNEFGYFIACPQLRAYPTDINITDEVIDFKKARRQLWEKIGPMTCDTYLPPELKQQRETQNQGGK